jgi:hypothetical protein
MASQQPINTALRPLVNRLVAEAKAKAAALFAAHEAAIKELDHFERSKATITELERVKSLVEKNGFPFYVRNHSSDEWLLTQFANRSILLNVNESEELTEAVTLGEYEYALFHLAQELERSILPYTYQDFLNGQYCKYFFELNRFYNVSESDYYAIRKWQTEGLRKIATKDYLYIVKHIQQFCRTLPAPLEFLRNEKKKIDDLILNYKGNPDLLQSNIQELSIFPKKMPFFADSAVLKRAHAIFVAEVDQLTYHDVHPKSLGPALQNRKADISGNEVTIFHTINKVQNWIELVLAGQPWQQEENEIDWDNILTTIREEADAAVEREETSIYEHVEILKSDPVELKNYLWERFDHFRAEYNAIDQKYYFHLLSEEKKYILKPSFVTNAFFSNDVSGTSDALLKAMTIHGCLWTIVSIYDEVFETRRKDLGSSHVEIISLLNSMVLDKESYDSLENAMNRFGDEFEHYPLPFEIFVKNQAETWRKEFFKGMQRLQNILDNAHQNSKIHYLQSRIKELRHRELQLNGYKLESKDEIDEETSYISLFKEFLQIEADYIRETKDIPLLHTHLIGNDGLQAAIKPQAFEDVVDFEKQAFILQMLADLSITNNGISILGERKKGAIRGIVESLKANNILPNLSMEQLCKLIAAKINLDLKSKLDESDISKEFKKRGETYIRDNYKK